LPNCEVSQSVIGKFKDAPVQKPQDNGAMAAGAVLIVAHPGHELLLHRWMEINRPTVFVLTDGSGSRGEARTATSREIVRKTGSRCGSVFGARPDDEWYQAILDGDASLFLDVAGKIQSDLDEVPRTIVVDAVEHYNPMHDLTAAVAIMLARLTGTREPLCYPVEKEMFSSRPLLKIELTQAELSRKQQAARSYRELATEVEVYEKRPSLRAEMLFSLDASSAFPEVLQRPPFYESFGAQRVKQGRFQKLITYRDHVRPLATKIISR
jgi:hypothetical protein